MAATKTARIDELLAWDAGRRVETARGPRLLRSAAPTPEFWEAWRAAKEDLKEAGIQPSKDRRTDEWVVLWWAPLPTAVATCRAKALAASRATDADVEIPAPAGLEYLPFQKAGIVYCLRKFGYLGWPICE